MGASNGEDGKHHIKVYIGVFTALMVATVITVSVSYMRLAIFLAVSVALVVATVKGSLVAAYFMHLKSEKPAIFWLLILTAGFWVLLMFIPVLTYLDSIEIQAGR